ncbi:MULTISPECIES: hypothetical protein [Subtercola]|nr:MULTISPECIES: hypothetical protein [Subtercola]MEA9984001.1 hypothetical protein [Subtercola sp. RTI3]
MVDNIVVRSPGAPLPKPLAGLATVLMWAVGIVLWSIAHLIVDPRAGAFAVDTALVLVAVGFALLFVDYTRTAVRAMLFGLVGIALFALVDFADLTVFVYMLRIIVPLFALMMPVNRIANGFRIFA